MLQPAGAFCLLGIWKTCVWLVLLINVKTVIYFYCFPHSLWLSWKFGFGARQTRFKHQLKKFYKTKLEQSIIKLDSFANKSYIVIINDIHSWLTISQSNNVFELIVKESLCWLHSGEPEAVVSSPAQELWVVKLKNVLFRMEDLKMLLLFYYFLFI